MKQLIAIATLIIFSNPHVQAQTFAATLPAMHEEILPAKTINLAAPGAGNKRAKQVMMTGFICMGVGVVMFLGGADLALSADNENNNNNNSHIGAALLVGGIMVFVAGTAMSIAGGAVYHHSKKHGYSIISPKKNQLGIAYNF